MNQLRRVVKSKLLERTAQDNPTFSTSPRLFSTDPTLKILETPKTGVVYGRITTVPKHTMKSDIINLLEGCDLKPENLKVEYSRNYFPTSMMVEFSSPSAYEAALRAINRRGRLYTLTRAGRQQWELLTPYDGKAIVIHGIPANALIDDVERLLSGCKYDSSSIRIPRQANERPMKSAFVQFPSQALAMHAYVTKNRGFCLNNQVSVQVLH